MLLIHYNTGTCLVTFSYRDYGYRLLESWRDPIKEFLSTEVVPKKSLVTITVCITEGSSFFSFLFKRYILFSMRRNTPKELHPNTYVYFGDTNDFRDSLRMHNTLTCYVTLLDKFGRVRWTGSGKAEQEEIDNLITAIKQLTPLRR